MPLRPLSLADAMGEAARHEGRATAKLERLARKLAPRGQLMMRSFGVDDEQAFLDLAWQEIDATRYLTPADKPRTLRQVAERIVEEFEGLDGLVAAPARPGLEPSWFRTCRSIQLSFDWAKVNRPWLLPATPDERRHSPNTFMYVTEGVHTTLAIALGLRSGERLWRPLEAVFVGNRQLADESERDAS